MVFTTDVQHGMQLPGLISQQALQVADKAVDVAFASSLADDVLVVVVAKTTAQLLIVHLGFVLPLPPQQRHLETPSFTLAPEDSSTGSYRTRKAYSYLKVISVSTMDNKCISPNVTVLDIPYCSNIHLIYLIRVRQLELPPISCPAYTCLTAAVCQELQ